MSAASLRARKGSRPSPYPKPLMFNSSLPPLLVTIVLCLLTFTKAGSPPTFLKASVQAPCTTGEAASDFDGADVDLSRPCDPIPIKNPFFVGSCLPLIRGSDSLPSEYDFDKEDDVLWEFQFQGKFTRPVKGPIYMSLEIPEKKQFKINFLKRQIVNGVLKVRRSCEERSNNEY